jgi:hypothetical protein
MATIPAYCPRCEEEWVEGQRIFQDAAGKALCRKCAMKAHVAKKKVTDMPDVPAPFGDGEHRKEDATMATKWSEARRKKFSATLAAKKAQAEVQGAAVEKRAAKLKAAKEAGEQVAMAKAEARQDSQDRQDHVQSETEFMWELRRAILFLRRLDEAGRAMVLELVKGA